MLINILYFLLISVVVYFGIALVLIFSGRPKKSAQVSLAFSELLFEYENLPPLDKFKARDNAILSYRYYPSQSNTIIILLHGSGWHSRYLLPLAAFLSSEGLARVFTPDLRGHGYTPERRGDVEYVDQFEDDLADFIVFLLKDNSNAFLILGGHSSGGGLAIRFAGSRYGNLVDAYFLLSPFLKYNAPTMRLNSGGWANPYKKRIIGLTMLNNLAIHSFDYLPAIEFNMPNEVCDGTETLIYSHRLNTAYAPHSYKNDLAAIKQPLLVVAGTADEAFWADRFEPVIKKYTEATVKLLPDVTHIGLIVGPEVRPIVKKWLENFGKQTCSSK